MHAHNSLPLWPGSVLDLFHHICNSSASLVSAFVLNCSSGEGPVKKNSHDVLLRLRHSAASTVPQPLPRMSLDFSPSCNAAPQLPPSHPPTQTNKCPISCVHLQNPFVGLRVKRRDYFISLFTRTNHRPISPRLTCKCLSSTVRIPDGLFSFSQHHFWFLSDFPSLPLQLVNKANWTPRDLCVCVSQRRFL